MRFHREGHGAMKLVSSTMCRKVPNAPQRAVQPPPQSSQWPRCAMRVGWRDSGGSAPSE
jgi:hypothetical protein